MPSGGPAAQVQLATIAREWARIGVIGFGGPPAHIVLLRTLCVTNRKWLSAREFEDGVAAANLLPGPAGAVLGGVCFIAPGMVMTLALSVRFRAGRAPLLVRVG